MARCQNEPMIAPLAPLALPADAARLLDGITVDAALATAVAHAFSQSPYLKRLLRTRKEVLPLIAELGFDAAFEAVMAQAAAATGDIDELLRAAKADVALLVALADLGGAWPLEAVTMALSRFADLALQRAVATALAERDAPDAGFAVLGLGKLGSYELNYSSDVDLIFLYDPDVIPVRPREDHAEAAVRIGRRIVQIMDAPTASGYVFRTDLRLRPSPEATPIAMTFAAAEHYYQSEALTWERVAFIRCRVCAGDVPRGQEFLDTIAPFLWRRSLDYTAIRDIQSVSLRIRDHYDAGQEVGPGFDLKRGRGGIHEVEFFAQIHQMIWGGRDARLRVAPTLEALAALADAGRIDAVTAAHLAHAYRFLRTVEHRLQMRADEQTHAVPTNAAQREAVAQLCGFADWRALERRLVAETAGVAAAYDLLIAQAGGVEVPTEAKALRRWLTDAKLKPAAFMPLIERWRQGKYRALRAEASRHEFEDILPELLATLAAAGDPAQAAARFDSFLEQLPAGLQFFALLSANPKLMPLLGRLLGVTPVLANALARDPALLDVLLAPDAFAPLPDGAALLANLRSFVRGSKHLEVTLDRVRNWTGEHRFQVGAQLIEARVDPLVAATGLSDLADAALQVLGDAVEAEFAATHGRIAGAGLIVLAMGRYGGRALTHASDLDLIFLFGGSHEAMSDGAKPLAATSYFNRLATRLTAALSVPTAAGALYEVDTRLRPSGSQGLLAVSLDSFARYQREAAWTWEHLALTRARIVLGDVGPAQAVITEILQAPRDAAVLRTDVLAMRGDIDAAKPGHGFWDVKLGKGGLVDLEFITHFLQLRERVAQTPDLRAAIVQLVALGHLDGALIDAHDLLTRLLIMLRLVLPDAGAAATRVAAAPAGVTALLAQATGQADFAALEAAVAAARSSIVGAWEVLFDKRR
jgi:glutamate-ammonia-ligase adenylyltransferase